MGIYINVVNMCIITYGIFAVTNLEKVGFSLPRLSAFFEAPQNSPPEMADICPS